MSTVTLQDKSVKTLKDHRCDMCYGPIPSGERCHYSAGQLDNEFYAGWQHTECWESFIKSGDDEYSCGDFPVPLRVLALVQRSADGA